MADYDLDGRPDLFVTNDASYNSLFHNLGSKFEEVAFETGVALSEDGNFISGMGLDFRDFNNDGYPDIVFVALEQPDLPAVCRTPAKGDFREITTPSGMRSRQHADGRIRRGPLTISTTMAGRICLSPAATSSRCRCRAP